MKAISECRLYTFIDTAYLGGRDPVQVARQLCEGGSDLIQLRAKDAPLAAVREMAERVLPTVREAGVGLVINDYPDIAKEVGSDLVHLGQEDFFGTGMTQISQIGVKVGLSTHSPEQAQRALKTGPAYIAIGPVYRTDTKPSAKPVTLEYVRWAAQNVVIPWFAIGGINLDNLDDVLAAGARRICVVSAILKSEDITRTCQSFRQRLTSAALK